MERLKLSSIPGRIVLALFFTTLPLLAALVAAILYVDGVNTRGRLAIANATLSANACQQLAESLTAMERNARQYGVLHDPQLLQVYRDQRQVFLTSLAQLRSVSAVPNFQQLLDRLAQQETHTHDQLLAAPDGSHLNDHLLKDFAGLETLAQQIRAQGFLITRSTSNQLQTAAQRAEHFLIWLSFAVIPAVLLVAGYFTWLIVRPMRQLDNAIHRLGSGGLDSPVAVSGPRDLRDLGRRLDWMRTRLLELEDQKAHFLRHMSHELKTPLASIREGSELLAEEVIGQLNSDQHEVATLLRQNSLRLQRQIEDLLRFNITLTRELHLDMEAIRLDREVRWVLHQHRLRIRSKNLRLVTRLAAVSLPGDRDKLRVIIDNLVSNAVKFSPSDGTLLIQLERLTDWALLEVTDDGPGIAPQERDKVFDAFYQTGTPHQDTIKGTGLGLSIARAYVKLHRGEIRICDSDRGTRIQVKLPLGTPTHQERPEVVQCADA